MENNLINKNIEEMEIKKAKIVREKTGASMPIILKYMKKFPKANIEELIDIIRYVGDAVYHKKSVEEVFKEFI